MNDDGATTEVLQGLVVQTLEAQGVLATMRASLRAAVFCAIHNQDAGHLPPPPGLKKLAAAEHGQLALALARELLSTAGMTQTTSVFDHEVNAVVGAAASQAPTPSSLARGLGSTSPALESELAERAGTGLPLLVALMQAVAAGALQPAQPAAPAAAAAVAAGPGPDQPSSPAHYQGWKAPAAQDEAMGREGKAADNDDAVVVFERDDGDAVGRFSPLPSPERAAADRSLDRSAVWSADRRRGVNDAPSGSDDSDAVDENEIGSAPDDSSLDDDGSLDDGAGDGPGDDEDEAPPPPPMMMLGRGNSDDAESPETSPPPAAPRFFTASEGRTAAAEGKEEAFEDDVVDEIADEVADEDYEDGSGSFDDDAARDDADSTAGRLSQGGAPVPNIAAGAAQDGDQDEEDDYDFGGGGGGGGGKGASAEGGGDEQEDDDFDFGPPAPPKAAAGAAAAPDPAPAVRLSSAAAPPQLAKRELSLRRCQLRD